MTSHSSTAPALILVDPERTTRAFVAKALRRAHYQVEEADSGDSGFDLFEAFPDARLVVIDAEELAKTELTARLRGTGRSVYIIAMTRQGSRDDTLVPGVASILPPGGGVSSRRPARPRGHRPHRPATASGPRVRIP